MYGFADQIDWQSFVGRVLEEVSFTTTTVNFHFDDNLSVTIMTGAVLQVSGGRSEPLAPGLASSLPGAVGREVVAVWTSFAELSLTFDNRWVLNLVDDSRMYESLSVRVGGVEYYV